ncbi:hypothetical protein MBRA1_001242 [Malassezia brasiliensis]|uniref:Uncharacterized protein n=1 Tax=Malassezia brasiliensis TaxID=1821822 RepID=A0AAF0DRS8_9BASI|nr:hypothetical protein MBRA1_001242 [Malassezia brasiliensis]
MATGFAHASCTKAAILGLALTSLVVSFAGAKPYIQFRIVPHVSTYHQYWQLATYPLAYTNSSELFAGSLLTYFAACPIERRFGARKFALFLALAYTLHAILSLLWGLCSIATVALFPVRMQAWPIVAAGGTGYLPGGPFGVLAALTHQYYTHVPPLWSIQISDVEFTDRVLVGTLAGLLAISQPPLSLVTMGLGILASVLYSAQIGPFTLSACKMPEHIATAANRLLEPWLGTTRLPFRPPRATYRTLRPRDPSTWPAGASTSYLFATPAGKGETGYVPAHVDHVMLFCPKLTQHLAAEDPARLTDQVLFYTSIANPVSHAAIAQQVALANALIDFASRRLVSVENAWDTWQLHHGDPDTVQTKHGREKLEQDLERFFSKWVWQWDVERQTASPLHASTPPPARIGLVAETVASLASCLDIPASNLEKPMAWFSKTTAREDFRSPAPDAVDAPPGMSEPQAPEPNDAPETDETADPDAPETDISTVAADDLSASVDSYPSMGLKQGRTTPELQEHHIPFPVREQSAIFSTNAPFQTLHEQLNQALGSDDQDAAPSPKSGAALQHSQAHAAYAAANPLASVSLSAPQAPQEKPADALPPRSKLKEAVNARGPVKAWQQPVYITYTTRKLLTVIHVWHTKPQDAQAWLDVSWELLRRVQRVVNDALLRVPIHSADYLHMDDRAALTLNHLAFVRDAPAEMRAGIEAQLLAAEGMLQRHHVKETLAREEHGLYWVAARAAADRENTSRTFLVLHGNDQRRYGIAECDQQMRRLAAKHSAFNL